MGILKDRYLLILISLGLFLRIFFINTHGFKFDMDAWLGWADRLNQVGFARFYAESTWTHYTPGYLYILAILGLIKNLFHIDTALFYSLVKLPSIIAEIILGAFVYRQIFKESKSYALIAGALVLLNPAFIFNSSVWGQVDGILTLLMALTIYNLNKRNLILSAVYLGLAILVKPQAIILLPILLLYLVKNLSLKNTIKLFLPFILTIFIISFPFFIQPLTDLIVLLNKMAKDYPFNSLSAYNFWGIFGFWISDDQILSGISLKKWGIILYILYWIPVIFFYLKRRLSIHSLIVLSSLSFYFLPTRVHERYLYPALVFLILLSVNLKSRILLIFTILLSLIHFLNLYYVYIYYNKMYFPLSTIFYNQTLYDLLQSNGKTLSMSATILFIFITAYILTGSGDVSKNTKS